VRLLTDIEQGSPARPHAASTEQIEAQLERILESDPFRHSKRHPRFLRFVVGKVLEGTGEEIKERLIGVEVFDRALDYDASSDPIVRVAAGEIRKRLAQYYLDTGRPGELRIDLHLGSYVPAIYWPQPALSAVPFDDLPPLRNLHSDPPASALTAEKGPRWTIAGRKYLLLGMLLLTMAAAAGTAVLVRRSRSDRELAAFWKPISDSSTALFCVGDLNFIMPQSGELQNASLEESIQGRNHLGQMNVAAFGKLSSMLGLRGVSSSVQLADIATLSDLRAQPVIFIGSFDNRWTERVLENTRYRIVWEPNAHSAKIIDTQNPRIAWVVDFSLPRDKIQRDYAIVARVFSPLTGQPAVVIAGVGPYGTTAASEFATNPAYFQQFVAQAPKGWRSHNVEIVLTAEVVEGRSAAPSVIAYDVR
jgi:hypothetical protein